MNTKFMVIQSCRCFKGFVVSRLKAREAVFVRRMCEQMMFQCGGEAVIKLFPTYMAWFGLVVFFRRMCERTMFHRGGEAVARLYPTYMARWVFGGNLSFATRFYRCMYEHMLFHIVGSTKLFLTYMALCRLLQ